MTPEEAIRQAKDGKLKPVYLLIGEEAYLRDRALRALREAALAGGVPGLNDDQLDAGEISAERALAVARTIPMMAPRRLVVVRNLERWEPKGDRREGEGEERKAADERPKKGADERPKKGADRSAADAFEVLAAYARSPVSQSILILVGGKVDKRRKFVAQARKEDWLVACDPLPRRELARWIQGAAREQGGQLGYEVADLIAELTGPELGPVADAVERLVLYAGQREVTEDDVAQCLVKLRPTEVWALTDAIGRRDLSAALGALDAVFDPRDAGRLVGVLAWSTRLLLKLAGALASGASPAEAAQAVGAPAFKANDLAGQVQRSTQEAMESWLETLSRVDLDVKGGSKRPPKAIFEHAIIQACAPRRSPGRAHR